MPLTLDEAIARIKENDIRYDLFLNADGTYTTNETVPRSVMTLPELSADIVATLADLVDSDHVVPLNTFATTAIAISTGVNTIVVTSATGADGVYDVVFSAGNAIGKIVKNGAEFIYVNLSTGDSYASAPTITATGLTALVYQVVIAPNVAVGDYFLIPSASADDVFDLYRVDSGPVATFVKAVENAALVRSELLTYFGGAFSESYSPVAVRAQTSWFASAGGNAVGVLVGTGIQVGDVVTAVKARLSVAAGATLVRLKLWSRPTTDDLTLPPGQVGDTQEFTIDVPLADIGLTAGGPVADVTLSGFPSYTVVAGKLLIVEIEARSATARILSGFGYRPTSSTNAYDKGWYRTTISAGYAVFTTGYAIAYDLEKTVLSVPDATAVKSEIEIGKTTLVKSSEILASVPGANGDFKASGNFGGWIAGVKVGGEISPGVSIRAVSSGIQVGTGATVVRLRIWERPVGGDFTAVPPLESDVLRRSVSLTLAQAGISAAAEVFTTVKWPLSEPYLTIAGTLLLIEIEALGDDGSKKTIGILNSALGAANVYDRGWFRANTSANTGYTAIASSASAKSITYKIEGDVYLPAGGTDAHVSAANASASGYTVTLDADRSTFTREGVNIPISGQVVLAAPTVGTVTDEAISLSSATSNSPNLFESPNGKLANANVSQVVVKDAGTLAVLVEGTDYQLNREQGVVCRVSAGASIPVLISYKYSRRRMDLIYLDTESLAIGVIAGTERIRDVSEFTPVVSSSLQAPLFFARVSTVQADATLGTPELPKVKLLPRWNVDNEQRRVGVSQQDYRLAQRYLPKTLAKLGSGVAPIFASYGDSIFAQGQNNGGVSTPNGTLRDIASTTLFLPAIGSDVLAAMTLYDHGDGGGAIHTHIGAMWTLFEVLNARFGVDIGIAGSGSSPTNETYLNFSIPGTATGTATNMGNNTTRLNALTASAADCVVVEFGTNELAGAATEANVVAIINACKAAGKEVIVTGAPWSNSTWRGSPYKKILQTNRALRRAAKFAGAAFVDTDLFSSPHNEGVLGLSEHDRGAGDVTVHPGPYEHLVWGRAMARLLVND